MKITTAQQLDQQVTRILRQAEQKESEETWKQFDSVLTLFKDSVPTIHMFDNFNAAIKKLSPFIRSSIVSERSRLCGTACDLVIEIAKVKKRDFEHYAETFIGPLLKIIMRANKVFIQRGTLTLKALIEHSGIVSLAHVLVGELKSPNKTYRTSIAHLTFAILKSIDASVLREHLHNIETLIKVGLSDAESSTRDQSKDNYAVFQELFPHESARFLDSLPVSVSKHLDHRSSQKSVSAQSKPSSHSTTTKSLTVVMNASKPVAEKDHDSSVSSSSQQQKDYKAVAGKLGALLAQFSERNPSAAASLKLPASLQNAVPKRDLMSPVSSVPATPRRAKAFLGPVQRIEIAEPQSVRKLPQPKLPERETRKSLPSFDFKEKIESSVSQDVFVSEESMKRKSFGADSTPKKLKSNDEVAQSKKNDFTVLSPVLKVEEPFTAAPKTPIRPQVKAEKAIVKPASPVKPAVVSTEGKPTKEAEPKYDVPRLLQETKKSDWSARMDSYQKLYDFIVKNGDSKEAPKVLDTFVKGLDDGHFRILKVVLDAWQDVIANFANDKTAKYLETILPRLVNISESPQNRTKSGIREQSLSLIENVRMRLDINIFITQLFNCLNSSDYSNNVRVKLGAISLIAKYVCDVKADFFNKLASFRMGLSRLSACIPESDKSVLGNIQKIMLEMNSVSSHLFFEAITYLSVGDKTRIKSLVGKKIPNYKQMEDDAVNVRRGKPKTSAVKAEPVKSQSSTSRVPVPTRQGSVSKLPSKIKSTQKSKTEMNANASKIPSRPIAPEPIMEEGNEELDLTVVGTKMEIMNLEDEETGSVPSEEIEGEEIEGLELVGKPIYIAEADDDLDPVEEILETTEDNISEPEFTSTIAFNDEESAYIPDDKDMKQISESVRVDYDTDAVRSIVEDVFIRAVDNSNKNALIQGYAKVAEDLLHECLYQALTIS